MKEVAEQQFKARVRKGLCILIANFWIAKRNHRQRYAVHRYKRRAYASRRGLVGDLPCFI